MLLASLKFSHKVFLAIFATAVFSVLIICATIYGLTSSYRWADFKDSYVDHMQLLGMALVRVEQSEGDQALGAAKAMQYLLQKKSPINAELLRDLASIHSVSQISVFDQNGKVIVSSGKVSDDVFSCAQVRDLLTGKIELSESPLSANQDGSISRDTMVASLDKKNIIAVSVQFSAVTHLLGEMAQHDEDNEYIEMIGPDNQSLGQLHRPNFPDDKSLKDNISRADGAYVVGDKMIVVSSLPARTQNYCLAADSKPQYRLITSISTQTFDREVRRLVTALAIIGVVLMIFAYFLARSLTIVLLRKIVLIRSAVSDITRDQDYSKRIQMAENSNDELDDLARGFNQMFAVTEANQGRLLEAERDKTKSQVAAQVAHDIRSPLMSMPCVIARKTFWIWPISLSAIIITAKNRCRSLRKICF